MQWSAEAARSIRLRSLRRIEKLNDLERLDEVRNICRGDVRQLARTLTEVENAPNDSTRSLLKALFRKTDGSWVMGITGSPGSGKSTLVEALARHYRKAREKVGIVAVDPTSPFSGGALLGDRVRMQNLFTDPGVFIRSMATRGRLGGLSSAVDDALLVLAAGGFKRLLVETVGVGQDEVDVVRTADVVLVLLVPGMGDDIQSIKAGIMEIGDIFVVNKADRPDAMKTERELRAVLSLASRDDGWDPPIVQTVATRDQGIEEVAEAVEAYRRFTNRQKTASRRRVFLCRQKVLEMIRDRMAQQVANKMGSKELDRWARQMANREVDPYTLVDRIFDGAGLKK